MTPILTDAALVELQAAVEEHLRGIQTEIVGRRLIVSDHGGVWVVVEPRQELYTDVRRPNIKPTADTKFDDLRTNSLYSDLYPRNVLFFLRGYFRVRMASVVVRELAEAVRETRMRVHTAGARLDAAATIDNLVCPLTAELEGLASGQVIR